MRRLRGAATLALVLIAAPARAGPPFVTDDPEPTDIGHWEIYNFGALTHMPGETAAEAGFDINYGAARDLQLTAVLPLEYQHDRRGHVGLGDVELAVKYMFIHQKEDTLMPDIAFFPGLTAPTAGRRFGSGRLGIFLPLWAQKDVGKWSLFGGGGYTINPGRDNRDYWVEGIALSRELSERLQLGAEIFHEGRDADDGRAFTGVNVGGTYRLDAHWSLLGSAGPGVQHAREQGRYNVYVSLKADY